MDAIGGYFELAEYEEGKGFPHQNGILLNTGQNALEYILRSIGEVKLIFLPFYTCKVVLEPLKKLHIPWTYYHINYKFEMVEDIRPEKDEYIIANNYFGIKDAYLRSLAEKYGDHLIVDCAQALFAKPIEGIKTFYSTRKFVGVADGGVAYLGNLEDGKVRVQGVECTVAHDKHLFIRKEFGAEAGFSEYQENERKLDNQSIKWMSDTTRIILEHIDFEKVIFRRRTNFAFLHDALKESNNLQLPDITTFTCPMVYPFISMTNGDLRKDFIDNKVFVAKYWPNLSYSRDYDMEYNMASKIIPIPCDHRYSPDDMNRIIKIADK